MSRSEGHLAGGIPPYLEEGQTSILVRTSTDQTRPTHLGEGSLQISLFLSSRNNLIKRPRIMFGQGSGHPVGWSRCCIKLTVTSVPEEPEPRQPCQPALPCLPPAAAPCKVHKAHKHRARNARTHPRTFHPRGGSGNAPWHLPCGDVSASQGAVRLQPPGSLPDILPQRGQAG